MIEAVVRPRRLPRVRPSWRIGTPGGFLAVTVAVAAFYVLLRAPILDPPNYLDPWIYTASFVNFGFIYHVFGWTYYPSRLPWVIPGIVAHSLFGPVAAFLVLHGVYFVSAGVFAFLLFRRYFGPKAALAAYGLLMLSPLFYDAYSNDYPDGALLTYLFGGVYFGLTVGGSRRPWLRAFWSGFFLAAAVGTNLFAGVVIACLLIMYAVLRWEALRRPRAFGSELGFGGLGALCLLVLCGAFSKAYGGGFLFFMPQVRALHTINAADYKAGGSSWMLGEPQLLLPVFAAACVLAGLISTRARRAFQERRLRFAIGAVASTLAFYGLIIVWELVFTGDFLETPYYFSIFTLGMTLCFGAAFGLLEAGRHAVTAVSAAAVAATSLTLWATVLPTGRTGAVVAVILMAISVLAVAAREALRRTGAVAALAVAALIGFTATYAADAGTITASIFVRGTYAQRRDVQDVAFQLISFMRASGLQKVPFQFWYDPAEDPSLNGIQSTYLWGDSWVSLSLPQIDAPMRRLLAQRQPSVLVLLCKQPACHGAPAKLRAAGYAPRPRASTLLAQGDERVWVRAFTLPKFAALNDRDPTKVFYRQGASPFASHQAGKTLVSARFTNGLPAGWSGSAASNLGAARGGVFGTSTRRWDYELVSPKVSLKRGSYAVVLQGRVVAGGLDLGVLDAGQNRWIEQRFYWYGQRADFGHGLMKTPFRISQPTTIQLILSNWRPADGSSRWQLSEMRLVRVS